MGENRGKDFENVIREAFESVPNCSVDRLHDQMNGFAGSCNICDFIMFKSPIQLYLECKSCYGNTLNFNNITKNQWQGLLEKSNIYGVSAGVLIWFIDNDRTIFVPIKILQKAKELGYKSVNVNKLDEDPFNTNIIELEGKKKRVFFDYYIEKFWYDLQNYMTYGG